VYLQGVDFPVTLSWYWLEKDDGTRKKRFVVSTKPLSGVYMTILGRRRWQIEGFFKVAKHRFGLHHFGQATLLGVYRWLVLCMIAYLLAHLASLWSGMTTLTDWGEVSQSLIVVGIFREGTQYPDHFKQQQCSFLQQEKHCTHWVKPPNNFWFN
jgi:Transposase DDE domain